MKTPTRDERMKLLDTPEIAARVHALADRLDALLASPPDRPVLVYFDVIGIAWPIRCLLHLARVDYELVQVPFPVWIAGDTLHDRIFKRRTRNGHLPLWIDGDLRLDQSNVLLAHLADRHGFAGDTERERLAVAQVSSHAYDALFHWNGLLTVNQRPNVPDDVQRDRLAAFLGEGSWGLSGNGFANHLDGFARYLESNPGEGGFIVGDRLSAADLHAFNVLAYWYKAFDRERFTTGWPELDAYIERVATIPAVADYIRHHQEPTTWVPLPGFGLKLTRPEETRGLTSVL